jgi:predicted AlkP superfamily pyrophosphatase or phosphodiesterase
MHRVAIAVLLMAAVISAAAADARHDAPAAQGVTPVKLVLLIAADQFRGDYLTRFESAYTEGFRRLLTDGAVFTNAALEHYPSVTAVGHSTMLSGALPSVSGIIGNDWYDRETHAQVTSVSDESVKPLGGQGRGASPHRLLVMTVPDQLKAAASLRPAEARPKIIGMSLKDRSAILPAGRGADAAYWFDTSSGAFISSSYYMTALPSWVETFNQQRMATRWSGATWALLDSPGSRAHKLPDTAGGPLYEAVFGSPYGNELLEAFAEQALAAERLGQRDATDVLTVSFSSNDSVGHTYGPDSPEVRDISIRTDRVIGTLLGTIDKTIGLDHVIVAFTADHGVAPVPEEQAARHLPGGRMTNSQLFDPIAAALEAKFGAAKWLLSTAGSSPYFDESLIAQHTLDVRAVEDVAAAAARTVPHVARVYTRHQLLEGAVPPDVFSQRIARSVNAQRSGNLEILLEPYWMRAGSGTTHGTPYQYDVHVPLVLMGPGIRPGRYAGHVALNDLAPTLASLLHVEPPGGSSGRVLTEALGEPVPARTTASRSAQ